MYKTRLDPHICIKKQGVCVTLYLQETAGIKKPGQIQFYTP